MSALAGAPAGIRVRPRTGAQPAAASPVLELALRVVAFAALCLFATLHWNTLVVHGPTGRAVLVSAVAAAGGAAMGAVGAGLVRVPRRTGRLVQLLLALATLALALTAIGLPARFLAPSHWDDLRSGIDRGITGTSTISWPYAGGDVWIRLTILLASPAAATMAAALAFVPRGRRAAEAGRIAALVVLVALYAFAVTEIGLGSSVTRGLALLVLIAAWLWLPRVRRTDAAVAAAVVVAAGLVAIPLSHTLDRGEPWIDWQHWSWFSAAGGERFQWDHRYGPLDWPRTGRTLLEVRSGRPHYWKAETLDHFDGTRWSHSNYYSGTDVAGSLPNPLNARWIDRVHVSLSDIHTDVLIAAGIVLSYDGPHAISTSGDGTTRIVDGAAGKGETYDVTAYVPDPTATQMRAAPLDVSPDVQPYIAFDLPAASAKQPVQLVQLAPWNAPAASGQGDVSTVLASPYRRMYLLARQLASGEPTTYDVVKRVEGYLQERFSYNEQPPPRKYPLESFLFRDRIGYCQQFSGAMALLLRMNGIPARVAAGFSPGLYDATNREYRVRDFDAHSWVEVWFKGIGWVPFDPTPSASPASSQASGSSATSAATGNSHDTGATAPGQKDRAHGGRRASSASGDSPISALWIAMATVAVVLWIAVVAFWLGAMIRARRMRDRHEEAAIAELAAALELLGYPLAPGTTLSQLEGRLRTLAGERAARYVRLLRDIRFSPHPGGAPTRADRSALRSALTAGRGPVARVRGYLALPPRLRHQEPPPV